MIVLPDGCAIRRASPADLAEFADLSRRTFADTYAASHAPDVLARHVAETFTDEALRRELHDASRSVVAAQSGDAWIGYAILAHGVASPVVATERPCEVARFYVDRSWHGRGVAAPLMQAALEEARSRGADVAWLGVWEQNSRAIRFYERCGFRIAGRATYLFDGHPENDHIMVTAL